MRFILVGFALIFLLTSCSKRSFRISVTRPAEIAVPEGIQAFAIVNNVTEENSPDQLLRQAAQGRQPNGNIIAAEQAVTGLLRAFDNSGFFQGIVVAPTPLRNPETLLINWNVIDSLCALLQTEGLIEIEYFESQAPVGGVILGNVLGSRNHPIRGSAFVNIYLPEYRSHLDRLDMNAVFNMPIAGNMNPLNILNDVMRKREYYGALGNTIGTKIGMWLSPSWNWVSRQYFKKGDRNIRLADNLIRRGHWQLAEQQLEPALNHPKRRVRGRALYNLAIVYEGQGHLSRAIEMAEKSAFEAQIRPAYTYINTLKRRQNLRSTIFFP